MVLTYDNYFLSLIFLLINIFFFLLFYYIHSFYCYYIFHNYFFISFCIFGFFCEFYYIFISFWINTSNVYWLFNTFYIFMVGIIFVLLSFISWFWVWHYKEIENFWYSFYLIFVRYKTRKAGVWTNKSYFIYYNYILILIFFSLFFISLLEILKLFYFYDYLIVKKFLNYEMIYIPWIILLYITSSYIFNKMFRPFYYLIPGTKGKIPLFSTRTFSVFSDYRSPFFYIIGPFFLFLQLYFAQVLGYLQISIWAFFFFNFVVVSLFSLFVAGRFGFRLNIPIINKLYDTITFDLMELNDKRLITNVFLPYRNLPDPWFNFITWLDYPEDFIIYLWYFVIKFFMFIFPYIYQRKFCFMFIYIFFQYYFFYGYSLFYILYFLIIFSIFTYYFYAYIIFQSIEFLTGFENNSGYTAELQTDVNTSWFTHRTRNLIIFRNTSLVGLLFACQIFIISELFLRFDINIKKLAVWIWGWYDFIFTHVDFTQLTMDKLFIYFNNYWIKFCNKLIVSSLVNWLFWLSQVFIGFLGWLIFIWSIWVYHKYLQRPFAFLLTTQDFVFWCRFVLCGWLIILICCWYVFLFWFENKDVQLREKILWRNIQYRFWKFFLLKKWFYFPWVCIIITGYIIRNIVFFYYFVYGFFYSANIVSFIYFIFLFAGLRSFVTINWQLIFSSFFLAYLFMGPNVLTLFLLIYLIYLFGFKFIFFRFVMNWQLIFSIIFTLYFFSHAPIVWIWLLKIYLIYLFGFKFILWLKKF